MAAWRLARRGRLGYAVGFALRTWWQHGLACAANELIQHLAQGAPYADWVAKYDTLYVADLERLHSRVAALVEPPLISLLMPAYNSPELWLSKAVASVRAQVYPYWELCLVDDASTAPHMRSLLNSLAGEDSRIRIHFRDQNGHISAATNDALAMARGTYIGLIDHDDLLSPHALALVALEIGRHPDADLIYSDEDKVDLDGHRFGPYFKPDWNPDLLRGQNVISHFGVYRTELARRVGGFRVGYEGSQDWDMALRVTEVTIPQRIRHLPFILYHWRAVSGSTATGMDAKFYAVEAGRHAVADHLARLGLDAEVSHQCNGQLRVHYLLPAPPPTVSLIVPIGDVEDVRALRHHLPDWLCRAGMPITELLLCGPSKILGASEEAGDQPVSTVVLSMEGGRVEAWQQGAEHAKGEVLLFMSPRLHAETDGWLAELVGHAMRPCTGAVGAGLRSAGDSAPGGGYILGLADLGGVRAGIANLGSPGHLQGRTRLSQNLSAVSGDCLAVCRERYLAAGGFDAAAFPVCGADVDFCLRLRQMGLWNTWLPEVALTWSQGYFRREAAPEGCNTLLARWPEWFAADPAYNPNLGLNWHLPIPDRPRQPLPWH